METKFDYCVHRRSPRAIP